MKRCLAPICGLPNDDSAEACKFCGSKRLIYVDEKLFPGIPGPNAGLNVGLLDPPKIQAPPATNVLAEAHEDPPLNEGQTNRASFEDQKPPEGMPINSTDATASQVWPWVKKQIKDPLMMGTVGIVGIAFTIIGLPQVLNLWNSITNNAPVIKIVKASPNVIQLGEEVSLTALADDAEERSLNYQWGNSAGIIHGTGASVTLSTNGMDRGSAPAEINVTLTVADSQQAQSKPYPVSIKISNSKPRLKAIELDKMAVRVGEPVKLIAVAENPAGDRAGKLHYEWNCPVGQIDRSDTYKTTLQTAGLNLRSAAIFPKVRVIVTNDRGESTEGEITLSITPEVRKVYRPRKNQTTNTTTLIIEVVKPLALDSRTHEGAAPQPPTSPAQKSPATPSEAPSPADTLKQTTKPPP